jgi:hypothetical protein
VAPRRAPGRPLRARPRAMPPPALAPRPRPVPAPPHAYLEASVPRESARALGEGLWITVRARWWGV